MDGHEKQNPREPSEDFTEQARRPSKQRTVRGLIAVGAVVAIAAVGIALPLSTDDAGTQERFTGDVTAPDVVAHADQSPPREFVAAGRVAVSAYHTTKVVKQSDGNAVGTYEWSLLNTSTGRYEKTDWAWIDVAPGMRTAAVLERDLPVTRIGVLEPATGTVERWIEVDKAVGGVQFSPDGKRLVATAYALHPDGLFKDASYRLNDETVPGPKPSRTGYWVIDVASGRKTFTALPPRRGEDGPGAGRQDFHWSLDGKLVWEAWGNEQGRIFYDLDGEESPIPGQEAALPSPRAVLSPDGRLMTGDFAGEGTDIVSEVLDAKTGRRTALVPGQQLIAWADDNHLIAWRCDPEDCRPGKGEFRNQLLLVDLDGKTTTPLTGFRKAKLRYDGRWTPLLTRR
ncbi:hypothetical protein [Streptomyces sp. C10-9-1]|uniref:hypothetical protein n=1 Tax=Streptomyces sp. C10-9-1 TaxID=1859285 RepID=UPI003D7248D7